MLRRISRLRRRGGGFNPFAKAYIDKVLLTRTMTYNEQMATNDFIKDLLLYNTINSNFFTPDAPNTSIIRGLYLLWWGSFNSIKYNLVNPVDTEVLTQLNTMSYNAAGCKTVDRYVVGLETPFYADDFPIYSHTIGVFPYENNLSAGSDIGAYASASSMVRMRIPSTSNNFLSTMYGSDGQIVTPITDSLGFFISSRTSRTSHKAYKNGVQIGTTNTTNIINITPPHVKYSICGTNAFGGTPRGLSLAIIGRGMTDAEVLYLNNVVQKYKASLGLLNYYTLDDNSILQDNSYLI